MKTLISNKAYAYQVTNHVRC